MTCTFPRGAHISLGMTVLSGLLCLGSAPVHAQSLQTDNRQSAGVIQPASKQFQLKATMQDRMRLSRDEITAGGLGMGTLGAPKPVAERVPLAPGGQGLKPGLPSKQGGGVALNGKTSQIQDPSGRLNEYNVDWSRWMTYLADNWYYSLRTAEDALGINFHTPRAALIEFTCYSDGSIGNIAIRQSSGVQIYDRLQVQTLARITPLPPFPKGTQRTSITLLQGWESHPKREGETDFQTGTFGQGFPQEKVRKWVAER